MDMHFTNNNSTQLYLVFGIGRLGSELVKAFHTKGLRVLAIDLNPNAANNLGSLKDKIDFLVLESGFITQKQQLSNIFKTETVKPVAFHTFLFTENDLQNWFDLLYPNVQYFSYMSTTLGYDRGKMDYENSSTISRFDPKIDPKTDPSYGGYVNGKMEIEILAKKIQAQNIGVDFFIPESMHIMGEGWPIGCAAAPGDILFRRGDILETIRSGSIEIPFGGENQIQGIHIADLSNLIVLALQYEFKGNYPVLSPEIWKVKDYYNIIAKQIGVDLKINTCDLSKVTDTLMMTLEHIYDPTDLQSLYIKSGFTWTPLQKCLTEMVKFYLNDEQKIADQKSITNFTKTDIGVKMNKLPLANPYKNILKTVNPNLKFLIKNFDNVLNGYDTDYTTDATPILQKFIRDILIEQIYQSDLKYALILRSNVQYTALLAMAVHQHYNTKAKKIMDTYPLIGQIISNDKDVHGNPWFNPQNFIKPVGNRHSLGVLQFKKILEKHNNQPIILLDLGAAFGVQWESFESNTNLKIIGVDLPGITDLAKAIHEHIFPQLRDFISFKSFDLTNKQTPAALTNLCLNDLQDRKKDADYKVVIYAQGLVRYIGINPIIKIFSLLTNLKNTDVDLILADNEYQSNNTKTENRVSDNKAVMTAGAKQYLIPLSRESMENDFRQSIPNVVFETYKNLEDPEISADEVLHISFKG